LIIQQVRNVYQAKHPRLRSYRNEVWDLIDNFFSAFNITFVPREENTSTDSLAVLASLLKGSLPPKIHDEVEIRYRPSILDNVKNWEVFEDDIEIRNFRETIDEFSTLHIDQDPDPEGELHPEVFANKIANHQIIQLPSNHIPRGLVPLERLFDKNDVAVKGSVSSKDVDIAE
jgi:hypothetical protein